ncbi:hypothetical protein T492DRAFT_838625 [Pavlovales sp. CCMP2436]|nr:hypothetical protein T492DRAFT_838625 [Pavlovales sp. CCMP2436]
MRRCAAPLAPAPAATGTPAAAKGAAQLKALRRQLKASSSANSELQRQLTRAQADAQEQLDERNIAYAFIEGQKDENSALEEKLRAVHVNYTAPPVFWKHQVPQTWNYGCSLTSSCSCKKVNRAMGVDELGLLVSDVYADGGYTCEQAAQMLRDSSNDGCKCPVAHEFDTHTLRISRIENHSRWQLFCYHESQIQHELTAVKNPAELDRMFESHVWLSRLEERNGLSAKANTRYLLHGTRASCLPNIVLHGLRAKFVQPDSMFDTGIYLTNSACKAWQYTDRNVAGSSNQDRGIILLCRVVLGKTELLRKAPATTAGRTTKDFPAFGFNSAMAKHMHTMRPAADGTKRRPVRQVRDEFIVFEDTQVYPEFVLEFGE